MASKFRLFESFTYCSNIDTTRLITVSMSAGTSFERGIIFTTTRKKPLSSFHSTARARSTPSTSTLMLPSGSLRLCTMLAMQPIVKMSFGCGSSTAASCCAARKIRLSLPSACSRARIDDGRPITNGIIMCGNTTTSRNGTMGRVSYTSIGWGLLLLTGGEGWVRARHAGGPLSPPSPSA